MLNDIKCFTALFGFLYILSPRTQAEEIIQPVNVESLGQYFPIHKAFDQQPTTLPLEGADNEQDGGEYFNAIADRWGYIDFGEDYQSIQLTQIWTLFRAYSKGSHTGFTKIWWDDDLDDWNDGVNADNLHLLESGALSNRASTTWVNNASFDTPLSIPHRYLIVQAGAQTTQRAAEIVFVGQRKNPLSTFVIQPIAAGKATGSLYYPLDKAFDTEVTWNKETQKPITQTSGEDAPYYNDRVGYIDFGQAFSENQITSTWTQYRQWSKGKQSGYAEYWWDDDTDTINDGTTETRLKFNSAKRLRNTRQSEPWVRDSNLNKRPIVPLDRYLMMRTPKSGTTNRAKEYALVGKKNTDHSSPIIQLPPPTSVFDLSELTLVDEVLPGNPQDEHEWVSSEPNVTTIDTIYHHTVRSLAPHQQNPQYFSYRLADDRQLTPNKAYVLVVEYPQDSPRSMFISNSANDSVRGFHTGSTIGDALSPPYVNPNGESLSIPLSGRMEKWQSLFHVHQRLHGIQRHRNPADRVHNPEDGVWITVSVLPQYQDPTNAGAAIARIAIYEAPSSEQMALKIPSLPPELPRRKTFWREEMADVAISHQSSEKRSLDNPTDWFKHRAERARMLGFNTFAVNLLEFGHTQYWDNGELRGWYHQARQNWLWDDILDMLKTDYPELNILPYYEYAGGDGVSDDYSLGKQKRAEPLGRTDGNYTHVSFSENLNVDITDPDTLTEAKRLLDSTIIKYSEARPKMASQVGATNQSWMSNRASWGYIDLGENYQDWRITQTWTRSRQYHKESPAPFSQVVWSSSIEGFTKNSTPEDVIHSELNFITQAQTDGSAQWTKDFDARIDEAITPKARYLLLKTPNDKVADASEFAFVGYVSSDPTRTINVLSPIEAGAASGNRYSLAPMFDAQPEWLDASSQLIGAWFRPRVSHMPMGFGDATRARFARDKKLAAVPTKQALSSSNSLKADYQNWWLEKRRDFLVQLQQHLSQSMGVNANVLFTFDATEPGAVNPLEDSPDLYTDNTGFWSGLGFHSKHVDQAIAENTQWQALTHPLKTWGTWEWNHSLPAGDPWHYENSSNVLQTYSFNRSYTAMDEQSLSQFRTSQGLAMIRHFSLNEDVMEHITGYFVGDMERVGKYATLNEARAVAYGAPEWLGYLSSGIFNSGSPDYVRAFNAAYLSLPALPSTRVESASHHPNIVIRKISTRDHGIYYAVVNVGLEDVANVEVNLGEVRGITDLVTQQALDSDNDGVISISLWAGQLKALHASSF